MDARSLWVPYVAFAIFAVAFLNWYPAQIINAIGGFDLGSGLFVGANGTQQIFGFTVVAAAISVLLIGIWVWKQERREALLLLGLLVGYIATISATMWYEQVYANLWDLANGSSYWYSFYYLSPSKLLLTLMDMSLIVVAYPWFRRANARLVLALILLTLVTFGGWYVTGFQFPTASTTAYFFNASSRVFSQLAISVAVYPSSGKVGRLWRVVPR